MWSVNNDSILFKILVIPFLKRKKQLNPFSSFLFHLLQEVGLPSGEIAVWLGRVHSEISRVFVVRQDERTWISFQHERSARRRVLAGQGLGSQLVIHPPLRPLTSLARILIREGLRLRGVHAPLGPALWPKPVPAGSAVRRRRVRRPAIPKRKKADRFQEFLDLVEPSPSRHELDGNLENGARSCNSGCRPRPAPVCVRLDVSTALQ